MSPVSTGTGSRAASRARLFGTKIADEFFAVHTGGDVAFINGVLKVLLAEGGIDRAFVRDHTIGFEEVLEELERESFADLEELSGASRADMERFARMYQAAGAAVLVWSMGITQHETGTENVEAIVNLGLARGNVGRRGAGLMPIRGHSGVQGGAEMGAYATALPGGLAVTPEAAAALSERYGFPVPPHPGLTASEMLESALRGELDVLYSSGGNFLEVLPDVSSVMAALERVPLRVHQDIFMSTQMLVDGETVVLLPTATRYEQRDGGTETTTERRIAYSPEVAARPVGEARSEWEIFVDLARRVDPDRSHLVDFESGQAIRDEIARVVPTVRRHRDVAPARVTPCSGAARVSVRAACSPPTTARAGSAPLLLSRATCLRASSGSAPDAGSSSTRWCIATSTR